MLKCENTYRKRGECPPRGEGAREQLSAHTKEQVVALDTALSEELTKSIRTLGEHLTALSRRFVEDYMPLTESLRSVVQMARGV